jgi:hypothetical protein
MLWSYQSLITGSNVITYIFLLEALLKIVAYGLFFGNQKAYLRKGWNLLDLFIVVCALISIVDTNLGDLKILRALRPLRLVSNNEEQRLLIESLLAIIPTMMNSMFFMLFSFYTLSIVGVIFFGGYLKQCFNPFTGKALKGISKSQCNAPNIWTSPPTSGNFDSVPSAFMLMYVCC